MKQLESKKQNRKAPDNIKNYIQWQTSRRNFVKTFLLAGLASQLPLFNSCMSGQNDHSSVLPKEKLETLRIVQGILFPHDQFGPGALDFKADQYLLWVLSDERLDQAELGYIKNGIDWVDETSIELYSRKITVLNIIEKEGLIQNISKEAWGKSWFSVILTFIFEAMLADPLYGSNPDGIGWKWLDHNPGQPRPESNLIYDEIFKQLSK